MFSRRSKLYFFFPHRDSVKPFQPVITLLLLFVHRFVGAFTFHLIIGINMVSVHYGMFLTYVVHVLQLCGQFECLSVYIDETFQHAHYSNGKQLQSGSEQREALIKFRTKLIISQHIHLLR